MTITKQRVEEIISRIEMYGHGAGYTAEEVYDLAVLALNLSNIANLKRYELDMDGCDSCGQDCGADMTEDSDGDYVLFDDVVKLFEFDTTTQKLESPAKEAPVSEIDYQELREIAKKATQGEWSAFISPGTGTYAVHTPGDKRCEDVIKWTGFDGQKNAENNARYIAAFNPEVVQALLDERERNQQYIKRRDQENEEIALTVGKLRVELEAAKKRIAELEAEPVSQTYKLSELSGNSPVTPDCWISCSERMPAQDDWILIYSKHGEYMAGQVQGEYVELSDGTLSWLGNALYWMPLPEPPQEVK